MSNQYTGNAADDNKRSLVADSSGNAARNVVSDDLAAILNLILIALGGSPDTVPFIFNVPVTAGTEFSQALPADTKGFTLKCRGNSSVIFSYVTAPTTYVTIPIGGSFTDDNFYTSQTIYFKCSKADTVEITAYT
jgi:hypothetical protein